MNKREAQYLLDGCAAVIQSISYQEWQSLIAKSAIIEKKGLSGITYQIEWNAFCDSQAGGDIQQILKCSFIKFSQKVNESVILKILNQYQKVFMFLKAKINSRT
jgi:hypothetical protein